MVYKLQIHKMAAPALLLLFFGYISLSFIFIYVNKPNQQRQQPLLNLIKL